MNLGVTAPAGLARLGRVMQLAFVPPDIDAATRFWTETMAVGPFFLLPHVRLDQVQYRNAPADIDFSIRLAYWGDLQIELIEQHNETASIFRGEAGAGGVHHVCIQVDEMQPVRALCASQNLCIAQQGLVPGGGEAIYVETGGGPGTMVEFLKPAPGTDEFFAFLRQSAREWDGTSPVRTLGA